MSITGPIRKRLTGISVLLPAIMIALSGLVGCHRPPKYTIAGSVDMVNSCDGQIPTEVTVVAELYGGNKTVGDSVNVTITVTGSEGKGSYTLQIPWPFGGNPTNWRVKNVTRTDGTDICNNPAMSCAPGKTCQDLANKSPSAPIGVNVDWRVSCSCQ